MTVTPGLFYVLETDWSDVLSPQSNTEKGPDLIPWWGLLKRRESPDPDVDVNAMAQACL